MLSPKAQLNLQHAREYFREHLCVGDYYSAQQKVAGQWLGLGAEKLGLKGAVTEASFLALCEGKHPVTGDRLTLRMNSQRRENGKTVANRRVFYDFTISPPKSVSVVGLYQDDRILDVHNRAVQQAMSELEKFAAARVRKSGQYGDRVTGNLVTAMFQHDTSRELDPHLHTHCVVLNATFDETENRWKALEVSSMYRAQKFVENYCYHELCKGLRSLGYEIEGNARDFEIKGVPASVIERFSKRHEQINEESAKRLKKGDRTENVKDLRERVARDVRKRRVKNATTDRLRPDWERQLSGSEKRALAGLRPKTPPRLEPPDAAAAVAWADAHLFERRSVVREHELLSAALANGRGQDFDLPALRRAIKGRGYVREDGTDKLTSRDVLRCEWEIVRAARDALRAIEEHGRLTAAEIHTIRRQDPRLGVSKRERRAIRAYRRAVSAAADGKIVDSFNRLDRLGWVRELTPESRREVLAQEYLAAIDRKESALVVAQTWDEVRSVNDAIREKMQRAGKVGAGDTVATYQTVDGTEAQKRDARFYHAGQWAYFIRGYGRFAKGELCEIAGADKRGVRVVKNGQSSSLSFRYADRIAIATRTDMEIAPGDRLQLKFNGRSVEGAPLANGELVTVRSVRKGGAIVAESDTGQRKTLTPSQRLFNRGYAITSYASQGKTVDTVLVADAASAAATNENQWYVAISRGRKRVLVFTSDKAALRANIQRLGTRELALSLNPGVAAEVGLTETVFRQAPSWLRHAWASIQRVRGFRLVQQRKPCAPTAGDFRTRATLHQQPERKIQIRP